MDKENIAMKIVFHNISSLFRVLDTHEITRGNPTLIQTSRGTQATKFVGVTYHRETP